MGRKAVPPVKHFRGAALDEKTTNFIGERRGVTKLYLRI